MNGNVFGNIRVHIWPFPFLKDNLIRIRFYIHEHFVAFSKVCASALVRICSVFDRLHVSARTTQSNTKQKCLKKQRNQREKICLSRLCGRMMKSNFFSVISEYKVAKSCDILWCLKMTILYKLNTCNANKNVIYSWYKYSTFNILILIVLLHILVMILFLILRQHSILFSNFINLRHCFQNIPVTKRPHVSEIVAFSKVSTLETKSSRFQWAFLPHTCGRKAYLQQKCLRIQTNRYTCRSRTHIAILPNHPRKG